MKFQIDSQKQFHVEFIVNNLYEYIFKYFCSNKKISRKKKDKKKLNFSCMLSGLPIIIKWIFKEAEKKRIKTTT